MFMDWKIQYWWDGKTSQIDLQFQCDPYQIPADFFIEIHKLILKLIKKYKESRIAITILKKNNKVDGLTLPNFTTYYKATVIITMWYWHKDRHINQRNRIKCPINPHIYIQLIFNKGAKTIQEEKNNL